MKDREPGSWRSRSASALAPREGDLPLVAPFSVMVDKLHRAIAAGEKLEPNFAGRRVPV